MRSPKLSSPHLTGITEALFRIFVQPSFLSQPFHRARHHTHSLRLYRFQRTISPLAFIQQRSYAKYRPPVKRKTPYDEEIGSRWINFVDDNNIFYPRKDILEVLKSFNREQFHLVQVAPPNPDDPNSLPTCKIFSKELLREQEREKARVKKDPLQTMKRLEINWAISEHDLGHYLKRLVEFLEKGRRVEVAMAPKRHGRKATLAECHSVVDQIKHAMKEVEGAKEWKKAEGKLGEVLTLHIDGREQQKKKGGSKP